MITKPEHVAGVRQAILDAAVKGRLVRQDPSESRKADLSDDRPAWLPAAWGELPLGEMLAEDSRNGYSRKPDGAVDGIAILKISAGTARRDGVVDESEYKLIGGVSGRDRDRLCLRKGDLLACRFNGNRDAVGILALFADARQMSPIYPDKLIRLRTNASLVMPELLRWWSRSPLIKRRTDEYRATTVGNWGISAGDLKLVAYPLPPLAEQRRIVAKIDELMAVCDDLEQSLAGGQAQRSGLLEALLRDALPRVGA